MRLFSAGRGVGLLGALALSFSTMILSGASATAQVSISLQADDSTAIPGSQRSYYANISGTNNLGVTWAVSGGCSLSSTTGTPVVVTAPSRGGTCTTSPTNNISFSSPVTCSITATAQDTSYGVQSATTTLPVCAPAVTLTVFPKTTVLYKGQKAVLQSDLRGSTTTGVTWTVSTNPGSAGTIAGGTTNRHAVFSATAAGTYVVTAKSDADTTKTASATITVTNNAVPTAARTDHTEPVDCTAVGSGTTYEVGPARAYTNLNMVPWDLLGAGDTVRIHNDDTTGSNPTVYNQRISIPGGGTATQPLRVCGVPDANGVKPIVDGANATTRSDESWSSGYLEPLALVLLYDGAHKGDGAFDQSMNVVVEGLHLRNEGPNYNYVAQNGGALQPYSSFSGCVWVQNGLSDMVRGNELENCAQAVFANAETPAGAMVEDLTVEGNYITNWGVNGVQLSHGMYLQSIGLTVQFNYFGTAVQGAMGNVVKTRSVLNFLRWNYISQPVTTTARAFDMVEPQSYACYVIPYRYAVEYVPQTGGNCPLPYSGADNAITADQLAANYEAYHSDFVYGNVMDDTGSGSGYIHYGYDQQEAGGSGLDRRGGTLYTWNNTHLSRAAGGQQKPITETAAPDQGHSYEFPTVKSVNNIFGGVANLQFIPNAYFWMQMTFDTNWMMSSWVLPYKAAADTYMGGTTAAEAATCNQYGTCSNDNGHLLWARNGVLGTATASLYSGSVAPFDMTTFVPTTVVEGVGTSLPAAIADQPSNLQYLPASSLVSLRSSLTTLGAIDGPIAQVQTPATPTPPAGPVAPTMTIDPALLKVTFGTPPTFQVTIAGKSGIATGTVTYTLNGKQYGTVLNANGVSSFRAPLVLPVGIYLIQANYSGSSKYLPASGQLVLGVTAAPQLKK